MQPGTSASAIPLLFGRQRSGKAADQHQRVAAVARLDPGDGDRIAKPEGAGVPGAVHRPSRVRAVRQDSARSARSRFALAGTKAIGTTWPSVSSEMRP